MSSDAITPEPLPEANPPTPAAEVVTPTPTPAPRFDAVPYTPDGGASPLGLALVLGGTLLAAVVIGCLVGIIKQGFYLVLIFPMLIGAAVGGVGMLLIKLGKVRSVPLAGMAAVLGGIMAMASMHYFLYQRFLDKVPGLRAVAGAVGFDFFTYLDLLAKEGVQIGKPGQKNGMNLGYIGSYIYWSVETLLVAGVAFAMMRARARHPFCRECRLWKEEKPLAMVATPTVSMAEEALREGQLASLLECAAPVAAQGLLLKVAACPQCGSEGEVDVTLEHLTQNAKNERQVKRITQVTYSGEVLRFLDTSPKAQ